MATTVDIGTIADFEAEVGGGARGAKQGEVEVEVEAGVELGDEVMTQFGTGLGLGLGVFKKPDPNRHFRVFLAPFIYISGK